MAYKDFKDFLPDAPDFRNEGLTDAKNVVPSFKSYRPMKGISSVSTNALTNRCQGFASFRSRSKVSESISQAIGFAPVADMA